MLVVPAESRVEKPQPVHHAAAPASLAVPERQVPAGYQPVSPAGDQPAPGSDSEMVCVRLGAAPLRVRVTQYMTAHETLSSKHHLSAVDCIISPDTKGNFSPSFHG
jgi:hypothetical protein